MGKRDTPFQAKHQLEYALEINTKGTNGVVTSVACLMCKFIGREEALTVGRKRKRTTNNKLFQGPPFRPEQYKQHHDAQHPEAWAEYQQLSFADKEKYFDSRTSRANTLHQYMDLDSDILQFTVKKEIIDDVVAKMFYFERPGDTDDDDDDDNDGEQGIAGAALQAAKQKHNALRLFKEHPDRSGAYLVTIKNVMRFELAVDYLSIGMSFRQTAIAIEKAKVRTKAPKLTGITDYMVGGFARILVGIGLQVISAVLSSNEVFGFSLAGDSSSLCELSYFDERIRVCFRGILYNLHLTAVPMFDRHTADNIVGLIVQPLEAVCSSWRDKLLAVSSDGENTMTGRYRGVVTQLSVMATHDVLRTWCVPHQADLVLKGAAHDVDDGAWIKTAYQFSVHLRAQSILITEMNSKCPKKTNRWLHLGRLLVWYIKKRMRLLQHVQEKQPASAPSNKWWTITFCIEPAIAEINVIITILQDHTIVISQQRTHVADLVSRLALMFSAKRTAEDQAYQQLQPTDFHRDGDWWTSYSGIHAHLLNQGTAARTIFNGLSSVDKAEVLREVGKYALTVLIGLSDVQAERDNANNAAREPAPPVLPYELIRLRTGMFIATVLDPHRQRVAQFWSEEDITQIEDDHKELVRKYQSETAFKERLDKHDHKLGFNKAWSDIDSGGRKFIKLRSFAGNLATAFPNTTSVESDFNILKWEKDEFRTCLGNLSVEGIFQAKQFEVTKELAALLN